MTEKRNREILKRRRAGETFFTLAKDFGVSRERARQIFEREERKEQRELELVEADRRPDQPNFLHLNPRVRSIVAEVCGKAEFTPDDVEEVGFWRGNFQCEKATWRVIVEWMALAGKTPETPPFRRTIKEWLEHDARREGQASMIESAPPEGEAR
ncbi:MAG: hypothetical protein LDL42_00080 [Rhizobium sp.]|nr:hypothetical protein [Rhizobium sp.]